MTSDLHTLPVESPEIQDKGQSSNLEVSHPNVDVRFIVEELRNRLIDAEASHENELRSQRSGSRGISGRVSGEI